WSVMPDFGNRCWPGVIRIAGGRRSVVLEPRMVRNVIFGSSGQAGRASVAASSSVRVNGREIETAHKCPPRHSCRVEHIANIPPRHLHLVPCRVRAHISDRIWITDYGKGSSAAIDFIPCAVQCGFDTVVLARD